MYGAQGQNRTADTRIFSPLLYRLSYLGLLIYCARLYFVNRQDLIRLLTDVSSLTQLVVCLVQASLLTLKNDLMHLLETLNIHRRGWELAIH